MQKTELIHEWWEKYSHLTYEEYVLQKTPRANVVKKEEVFMRVKRSVTKKGTKRKLCYFCMKRHAESKGLCLQCWAADPMLQKIIPKFETATEVIQ